MRHQHRRYARVIVNDLSLGKACFRVEDFVQVRQLEEPATNFDILIGRQGGSKKLGNLVIELLSNWGIGEFKSALKIPWVEILNFSITKLLNYPMFFDPKLPNYQITQLPDVFMRSLSASAQRASMKFR